MHIVFHANFTQPHQIEHGQWLADGFRRHGLTLEITPNIHREADVHIVSGPHYALERWKSHPRTIWLDKRFYRDEPRPPEMVSDACVSLAWLRDGHRVFSPGENKTPPLIGHNCGSGTIFLAEYGGIVEPADTVRLHPLDAEYDEPLESALARHKTAIGYQTTALVKAALMGLEIDCRDEHYILNQPNWLELLPYADWHYLEIQSGEAWEHLASSLPR